MYLVRNREVRNYVLFHRPDVFPVLLLMCYMLCIFLIVLILMITNTISLICILIQDN